MATATPTIGRSSSIPAHTADSALAAQMQQLLDDGSPIARDCLRHQLGQLSKLASCRGPWTLSGNNAINISVNPLKMRLPQRAQLRFQLSNPLGASRPVGARREQRAWLGADEPARIKHCSTCAALIPTTSDTSTRSISASARRVRSRA